MILLTNPLYTPGEETPLNGKSAMTSATETEYLAHLKDGFAALERNDIHAAIEAAQAAMARQPEAGAPMFLLGLASFFADDLGRAISFFEEGHKREPDYRQYVDALAVMNARAGRLSESIYYAKLATVLDEHPDLAGYEPEDLRRFFDAMGAAGSTSYFMDAVVSNHVRDYATAIDMCSRELRMNPRHAPSHALHAEALAGLGVFDRAVAAHHAAIHLDPGNALYMAGLGQTLRQAGRLSDSQTCFREALILAPEDAAIRAAYASTLAYVPGSTTETIADIARLPAPPGAKGNGAKPKLTIGYLVGFDALDGHFDALEALFANHSLSGFDVFGYQQYTAEDSKTDRLRALSSQWREIYDVDDETLKLIVEGDGVDILVDLCGLSADSRREALARRLAPVQVGWLGFPLGGSPGGMDYLLSSVDTAAADARSGAKPWPVDGALLGSLGVPVTLSVVAGMPAPVAEAGSVTFGAVCDLARIAGSAGLWSRVLKAVPGSRLLLGHTDVKSDDMVDKILDVFGHFGVSDRLEFQITPEHEMPNAIFWQQVDIFLDATPAGCPVETVEALAVGVPVVSLAGTTRVGLISAGVLRAAHQDQWIAVDEAQYVAKAAGLGKDPDFLINNRRALADRVGGSSLLDGQAFTQAIETAYRGLWKDFCGG